MLMHSNNTYTRSLVREGAQDSVTLVLQMYTKFWPSASEETHHQGLTNYQS